MKLDKLLIIGLSASLLCIIGCENSTNFSPIDPSAEKSARKPDSVYKYIIGLDSQDKLEQIIYYTYDIEGNMILQFDSMVTGTGKNKIEMEYNAKGLMVEKREYSYYNYYPSHWSNDYYWQYTYNEKNQIITEKLYIDFSHPLVGNPDKKMIYKWIDDMHANGLVYDYALFKPQEDPWMISERIEYIYNLRGDVEKSVSYWLWGTDSPEGGKLTFTNEYKYDQYGNMTSHILYERDTLVKQEYYKYEYNDAGEILRKWYSNKANNDTSRVYTAKYVYFY